MLLVIPYWIDWSAPWVVYSSAVIFGRPPERLIALAGAACLAHSIFILPYRTGQMLHIDLIKDLAIMALCSMLALRIDRWWLILAAICRLLNAATDIAGMIHPFAPWAIGTAAWTWHYLFLATLAWGAWQSYRAAPAPNLQI